MKTLEVVVVLAETEEKKGACRAKRQRVYYCRQGRPGRAAEIL